MAEKQTIDSLLNSRNKLFWALHISGWGGYTLAAYLGALAHEKPDSYISVILLVSAFGMLLSTGMRYLNQRLWNRPVVIMGIGMVLISYLVAMPWTLMENLAYWDMVKHNWRPDDLVGYMSGLTGNTYVLLCWSGLYFGIKYYRELQDQTQRTLKATAAAHQAQLKMLRYQLNPHFLFNTLNAISTLILDQRNDIANQSVTRLSAFLRHTLDNDPMKKVTLAKEIEALELYLSIEQVRFGDRLRLSFDIEESAQAALLPSLILQPLVENAIKFAVTPQEAGGLIAIQAKVTGRTLHLVVSDDGPGLNGRKQPKATNASKKGVGLANTRERLEQLYGDQHRFELTDNEPHGLIIRLEIPYETD